MRSDRVNQRFAELESRMDRRLNSLETRVDARINAIHLTLLQAAGILLIVSILAFGAAIVAT